MSSRYSYSTISDFKACPLRYYLRHVKGLEPRDAASNSHHLAWGAALHSSLEAYYKWAQQGQYPPDTIRQMDEIFAEGYPTQLDPLDKAKTQENGIRALSLYVDRWAEEDQKWRVIEIEGPGSSGELISGLNELHCDLIVENLEHGGIYVVDHKTTSKQLGPWYWDRYDPNSQITYYIDYCQEKYGSCEGFIINAISLQWRDSVKKDGANNVAWFRLDDPAMPWLAYSHHETRDYRGGALGKKGQYIAAWGLTVAFERQTFQRSRAQIEQERSSTSYWKDRIEGAAELSYYAFDTSSCYSCAYRGGEQGGICKPGYQWPSDREIILLGYRQVCRSVIAVTCPACTGKRFDSMRLSEALQAMAWEPGVFQIEVPPCLRCKGLGTIDGPRCQLDRGHQGICSDSLPATSENEIEVEVNV